MGKQFEYQHLKPKRGSNYRQLFVDGRIRAEVVYRKTVGVEPMTPEEVARDCGIPVAAVLEAIEYCIKNGELLDAERNRETALIQADGRDKWPYAPVTSSPTYEPLSGRREEQ